MPLNAKSFAIAGGFVWGLFLFGMAFLSITMNGMGSAIISAVSSFYIGYEATWPGSIIGFIYGFVDGFIGLYIFAWLYNWLEKRERKSNP